MSAKPLPSDPTRPDPTRGWTRPVVNSGAYAGVRRHDGDGRSADVRQRRHRRQLVLLLATARRSAHDRSTADRDTHASTHVKYLLPVGATTAEKLEGTSCAVAADRLASVFQSRPAVTRRGPRPRPQNFGLETKTAVSRTTHPPSLSSSVPFPSPVVAAPIFHPFHSLPSTLLSFSR